MRDTLALSIAETAADVLGQLHDLQGDAVIGRHFRRALAGKALIDVGEDRIGGFAYFNDQAVLCAARLSARLRSQTPPYPARRLI